MRAANVSGVLPIGVAPSASRRAFTVAVLIASAQSLASFALMAGGRPAGPSTPHQTPVSNPGRPDSAIVGTFGTTGERIAVVTPSGRTVPAVTCAIDSGMLLKVIGMWPPIRSVSAGAPPLYGTGVMSILARYFRS